ncbi:MAG: carbohydrate-binding family 9-like protein [Armatimonadetes bacterium]|nr:carbohydrate-binding family 9-like protein [Armatimonadota bacterium]
MAAAMKAVLLVLALIAFLPAACRAGLPAYLVKFAAAPSDIDGRLDDPAWEGAEWSSDFVWIDAGDTAPLKSRFKAIYDRDSLYFVFQYESLPRSPEPLDPDLLRACEIFLDAEGRGRRYLEYAVSPDGDEHSVLWRGRLSVREWKGALGIETRVGIGRASAGAGRETVTYEIAFPWAALKPLAGSRRLPPQKGDAWRANFSRVEAGEHLGDYVWSPAGFYYMHHPDTFGWLVFAGEEKSLNRIPPALLTPLPDDTARITGSPHFRLFSRLYWARFPLMTAGGGDVYAASKCELARLDASGRPRFTITRRDGLPQFIRSLAQVREGVYLAGSGIGAGLAFAGRDGKAVRISSAEGYLADGMPLLIGLDENRCLAAVSDRFQIIDGKDFSPLLEAAGRVLSAVSLAGGKLAVGTDSGFSLYGADGHLLGHTAIAGGIAQAAPFEGAAIGVSGKNGLYRLEPSGKCSFYPSPLRIRFDRVFMDSKGRCWAAYTGGIALIDQGKLRLFHEPLGMGGFRISGIAESKGRIAFTGAVPSGTWYTSSQGSPFVLLYDRSRWESITFRKGLPGDISALASLDGELYLSTTAGVYRLAK